MKVRRKVFFCFVKYRVVFCGWVEKREWLWWWWTLSKTEWLLKTCSLVICCGVIVSTSEKGWWMQHYRLLSDVAVQTRRRPATCSSWYVEPSPLLPCHSTTSSPWLACYMGAKEWERWFIELYATAGYSRSAIAQAGGEKERASRDSMYCTIICRGSGALDIFAHNNFISFKKCRLYVSEAQKEYCVNVKSSAKRIVLFCSHGD